MLQLAYYPQKPPTHPFQDKNSTSFCLWRIVTWYYPIYWGQLVKRQGPYFSIQQILQHFIRKVLFVIVFLQTHTRTRKAANIRIYQHVTGVNQDHLHSVTQSSMDRTEPANTFAGIIRQKSALKRFVMLNQSFWWFWLVPAGQGELLQAQNGGWNSCKKWTYMLKGGVKVGPGIGESRTALATGVSSSSEEEELSRDQVIFPGTKTCLHSRRWVGWGGSGGGKRNHQRPLGSQPHWSMIILIQSQPNVWPSNILNQGKAKLHWTVSSSSCSFDWVA